MADLRIVDAPLLSTVKGTEKIPTGGEGNFSVSVNQVADFAKLKWFLATEEYVDNAVGNVQADLNLHKNNSSNPHGVTKVQVGLGNVDNTADLDKPVSNATQSAIITANSSKADKSYVDSQDQLKADKNAVETSLLLKADKTDLKASKIMSDGGQIQQVINDFGGAKWYAKVGGYELGATVKLANGDTVKSTMAANTVNPNIDMTGWIPDSGILSFDMFGIDKTGTVAVDAEIRRIAEISTALKLPIQQFSGSYLLDGSGDTFFTENTLLDGSKFILGSNFTGRIICKRADEFREEITSGTFFNQVKAVGILNKGQTFLNLGTNYQDHFMTFETSQPLYYYRGGILETAFLQTRHFREGRIDAAPFFQFDLSKLTKIKVARANDSVRLYSGFTFDESATGALADFFKVVESNMVAVRNVRYVNRGPERNSSQTRLTGSDCYALNIDGLDTSSPHPNPNNTFSYTLTLDKCFDVEVRRMKSQGRGWGTVGNNSCTRVKFIDCDVNRIDFHRPCYEKLTIENCRIGDWGIVASLVCDTYLTNTHFLMSQGYGNRGYIRSNQDTSGFCNGDLFINNVTINGYLANGATFIHARHGDTPLPVGSPLVPEMFTNVYIDGLHHNGIATANITSLFSSDHTGTPLNMLPKRIHVANSGADAPTTMFDIHVDKFALRTEGVDIKYTNVSTNTIAFRDSAGIGTKARVKLNNVSGQTATARTVLYNTANFDIDINNCDIAQYAEYLGAWTAYSPKISMNGGSLVNISDVAPFLTPSGVHNQRIKAINVDFNMPTMTGLAVLYRYQPVSCWFNGLRYIPMFETAATVNTGNFTIDTRSGTLRLLLEHGTLRYETTVNPLAGTYTTPNGATIVVTVVGANATITVNATNLKLIGLLGVV